MIIDSKPSGAVVYLDDKKNGVFARTPWQGSLPPKSVKLIVEAKGWKPEERVISPRTDKVYEVYVALSEEHFLGWIEVASNVAGADVFLDKQGDRGHRPHAVHRPREAGQTHHLAGTAGLRRRSARTSTSPRAPPPPT